MRVEVFEQKRLIQTTRNFELLTKKKGKKSIFPKCEGHFLHISELKKLKQLFNSRPTKGGNCDPSDFFPVALKRRKITQKACI